MLELSKTEKSQFCFVSNFKVLGFYGFVYFFLFKLIVVM